MGAVEGVILGSIEASVDGARADIGITNKNVLKLHEKVDDLLSGRFIPVEQYNKHVEHHNRLVAQFKDTRAGELGNYKGREAAVAMIEDLTGRERDDIMKNDVHGKYWEDERAVKRTDAYAERRKQSDRDAGII